MKRSARGELPLGGGEMSEGVVRVGDTVRRPRRTPLMHEVLLHLERAGFDGAPRWLGVDERGRDVLSWIDGETFRDRSRLHPYIGDPPEPVVFSDGEVEAAFGLLRRYHDAFGEELICHGDYGPWNLVWRDGKPIAIIDFDNAHPGEAAEDVAYALRMFVGYGLVAAGVPELVRRTRAALSAYGRTFEVAAILEREYELARARCVENGWDRQLERLPVERAWLESNRAALSEVDAPPSDAY